MFWQSTSAPCAMSVSAAWRSLPGSYQVSTQITFTLAAGLTLRAPSVKASMLRITSGIGNETDIAERVRLRHLARQHAQQVRAFMEPGFVRGDVRRDLVTGVVLEVGFGKELRDLERGLHVAERRREDELIAGGGELTDDALRVRGRRDVLDEGGFHLGAEGFLDLPAPEIVLIGPARIAHRIDVDERHLQRLIRRRRRRVVIPNDNAAAASMDSVSLIDPPDCRSAKAVHHA